MINGTQGAKIWSYYQNGVPRGEIARRLDTSLKNVSSFIWIRERGFNSYFDYKRYLANQKGVSVQDGVNRLAREKGFASERAYKEHLLKKRGIPSLRDYHRHLAEQNKNRIENTALKYIIRDWLFDFGESISGLARGLGWPKSTVHLYARGESAPTGSKLKKLLDFFGFDYDNLEDLVGDVIFGPDE